MNEKRALNEEETRNTLHRRTRYETIGSLFVRKALTDYAFKTAMKTTHTAMTLGCLLLVSTNSYGVEYPALVRAITAVESAGDPMAVGLAGERGLMQLKSGTWRDMTRAAYGSELPFEYAFHSKLNQRMGRDYLEYIATRLEKSRSHVDDSFLPLLIASYNLGPNAVAKRGYVLRRMPQRTRSYVERVGNMYQYYLSTAKPAPEADALSSIGIAPPLLQAHLSPLDETPEFLAAADFSQTTDAAPASSLATLSTARQQQAGLSSLIPLFLLATVWSLYRAHLRSRKLEEWIDDVVNSTDEQLQEFDFGMGAAQA